MSTAVAALALALALAGLAAGWAAHRRRAPVGRQPRTPVLSSVLAFDGQAWSCDGHGVVPEVAIDFGVAATEGVDEDEAEAAAAAAGVEAAVPRALFCAPLPGRPRCGPAELGLPGGGTGAAAGAATAAATGSAAAASVAVPAAAAAAAASASA